MAAALFTEPVPCQPARAVPVLSVHGTADEVLPYGGQGVSVASPLALPALPTWLAEWAARTAARATRPSSSTPPR